MTALITSIEVKHTNAPHLRITAKIDMPEYGINAGDVVYLVYSVTESKAQGKRMYHIVRWSFEAICWACPCNGFYYRSECSHARVTSDACKAHKTCMLQVLGTVLKTLGSAIAQQQEAKNKRDDERLFAMIDAHVAVVAAEEASSKVRAKKQEKRATAPLQPKAFSILKR